MRRFPLAVSIAATLVMLFSLEAGAEVPFERPRGAVEELTKKRTPTSRTWSLANGQQVTQIVAEPEQWKDANGVWQVLRPDLRLTNDRWEAQSAGVGVSMPTRLSDATGNAIRVTGAGGDEVTLRLAGASGMGVATGSRLSYDDVRPGVDVAFDVVPAGVKETVTLSGKGSSRSLAYALQTGADDLVVEEDGHGGAVVKRGDARVFAISKPAVADANGDISVRARLSVERRGGRAWELRAVLDDAWLDSPERRWPVIIDPTILDVNTFRSRANDDCQSYYGNDAAPPLWKPGSWPEWHTCNQLDWRSVGHHEDGAFWYAGYQLLRFNTFTLVQSDQIASAKLSLYRGNSIVPNRSDVGIYPLTADIGTIVTAPTPARHHYVIGRYDERQRVGVIPAGPVATVAADVTGAVTQWRRYSDSSGRTGIANRGLLLRHEDLVHLTRIEGDGVNPFGAAWCRVQACDRTVFASSANPDASLRPVLEVTSWPAAPAGSRVISPTEGELSGRWIKLQARATDSSVTTVRFQYIAGGGSVWRDIPLSALRAMDRTPLTSQDVPVEGPGTDRRSRMVVWDVAGTPGGDVDGPVRVRAFLESPTLGHGGMTDEVEARLDRRGISRSATVDLEPGRVDLTTGEFSMAAQDASFDGYLQDLTLTRTYTSRGVAKRNADMFGPGWEANVEPDGGDLPYKGIYNFTKIEEEVIERQELQSRAFDWEVFWNDFFGCLEDPDCIWEDPDGPGYTVETIREVDRWEYRYAVIELADGTKTTFRQTVDPNGQVTGWLPEDDLPGYSLQHNATGTAGIFEFVLTEPSGGVARFRSEISNSPNYRLISFTQPGSPTALSYTYEPVGNRQRVKRVTAPHPAGGTPRWMEFDWTGVMGCPENSACDPWRVTGVRVGSGTEAGTTVAAYGYDSRGRLAWVTDPRVSPNRIMSYGYDSRGLLSIVAPPGEAAWGLAYTRQPGDDGPRLESITRAHPGGGAAVRTVRYGVSLSGAGAPHDMSVEQTARWNQIDHGIPWDAVAVFPADDVPAASNPDYTRATIYYTDASARLVNVAEPGGHIATIGYDANDNVVRELSPANRSRALAAGASSATVAEDLSTVKQYEASGIRLVATYEPKTDIRLSNGTTVTGRRLTSTHYDENAPAGGPFHLPTSEWRAVDLGNGNRADEHELVRYGYGAYGGVSGWTARQWTEKVVDPAGRRLTSYRLLHPTYPLVEETRTPGGAAGGARPDVRYYQYAGIAPVRVPTGVRGCYNAFEIPAGFRCVDTDGMPAGRQDHRYFGYDSLGRQIYFYETPDGYQLNRITGTQYHADGQVSSRTVWDFSGAAIIGTTYTLAPSTGRVVRIDAVDAFRSSTVYDSINREYDSNGRLSKYTDAAGTVTRYSYDLRGRTANRVENDMRITRFGYDDRDNLISVTDPAIAGPMTATHDPDGQLLTETLAGGLELSQTFDPAGNQIGAVWTRTSGCASDCVMSRSVVLGRDVAGRITQSETNNERQTARYDTAGRLAGTDTRMFPSLVCKRTTYVYDGGGAGDSNRTSMATAVSASAALCGTGGVNARTWTYDPADRTTNSGWTFDPHGRATAVPAPDSGGRGILTASYYADDRVRSLTLDGRLHVYTRDPLRRTKTVASSGVGKPSTTAGYQYGDDTDQPVVVGGQRNILGPSEMLVATAPTSGEGATYQLRDIHGSIVRTVPVTGSGAMLSPNGSTSYGEFGAISKTSPAVIDWTNGIAGYGWLGAHQRTTEFEQIEGSGPPIEMGARVYLPSVGRFLQRDPIEGGSANAYDYAWQDPLNLSDLDGLQPCRGGMNTKECREYRRRLQKNSRGRKVNKSTCTATRFRISKECGRYIEGSLMSKKEYNCLVGAGVGGIAGTVGSIISGGTAAAIAGQAAVSGAGACITLLLSKE